MQLPMRQSDAWHGGCIVLDESIIFLYHTILLNIRDCPEKQLTDVVIYVLITVYCVTGLPETLDGL